MIDNKIELRSEKIRHIIGEIPSRIVRYGITIITIVILGLLTGYAPLYPLPIIIALSFHLDSTEAHFFRKYIIHELQRPSATITSIFLFGETQH